MMVLDATPPVITGQGISDARNGVQVIDLPDAPDPVSTGPGESDARFDIRAIVLPDAPDPVRTGPGESDARDPISPVEGCSGQPPRRLTGRCDRMRRQPGADVAQVGCRDRLSPSASPSEPS